MEPLSIPFNFTSFATDQTEYYVPELMPKTNLPIIKASYDFKYLELNSITIARVVKMLFLIKVPLL